MALQAPRRSGVDHKKLNRRDVENYVGFLKSKGRAESTLEGNKAALDRLGAFLAARGKAFGRATRREAPATSARIVMRPFWEAKGLRPYFWTPAVNVKMERVNELTRRKLEAERLGREKEALPGLVDECAKWAQRNRLRKVTKANVNAFLADKEVHFSRITQDSIYTKVNLRLQGY